jgi:hypothetical protein
MLDIDKIIQRAAEIKGSSLSPFHCAIICALCEAINTENYPPEISEKIPVMIGDKKVMMDEQSAAIIESRNLTNQKLQKESASRASYYDKVIAELLKGQQELNIQGKQAMGRALDLESELTECKEIIKQRGELLDAKGQQLREAQATIELLRKVIGHHIETKCASCQAAITFPLIGCFYLTDSKLLCRECTSRMFNENKP